MKVVYWDEQKTTTLKVIYLKYFEEFERWKQIKQSLQTINYRHRVAKIRNYWISSVKSGRASQENQRKHTQRKTQFVWRNTWLIRPCRCVGVWSEPIGRVSAGNSILVRHSTSSHSRELTRYFTFIFTKWKTNVVFLISRGTLFKMFYYSSRNNRYLLSIFFL